MKRAFVFIIVLILLAGLGGGLAYFQYVVKPEMIKGFISGAAQPPATVTAEAARAEKWTQTVPAIGTFKATRGIDVASQVSGIVRDLQIESGQEVAAGTILVQVDDATEQADLKAGLAQLKNADLAYDRQATLVAGGSTSRANLDAAIAARDQAQAQVDRTRSVIAQKTIRAPFPGRLGIRKVDLGQYVSPGMAIVTLQQLDPIYVDFPVPEQEAARVRVGQKIEARVDAYPDQAFQGVIRSIEPRVTAETRSLPIRAEIANSDRKLLPGMFANVSIEVSEAGDVVTVARTAITYSLYGDSVFVAVKPGEGPDDALVAERRFVRLGDTRGDRVAVTEGVKVGEMVVTSGQVKLNPDAKIRIDNSAPLTPQRPPPKL